jgi:hypothetical protein
MMLDFVVLADRMTSSDNLSQQDSAESRNSGEEALESSQMRFPFVDAAEGRSALIQSASMTSLSSGSSGGGSRRASCDSAICR